MVVGVSSKAAIPWEKRGRGGDTNHRTGLLAAGVPACSWRGEFPRHVGGPMRPGAAVGAYIASALSLAACGKKPPPPPPPPTVGYVVLQSQPVSVVADLPG